MRPYNVKLPLLSRLMCKFLWHSCRGVVNEHGVLEWMVCTRCGIDLFKKYY